jgi:hypothetical protein
MPLKLHINEWEKIFIDLFSQRMEPNQTRVNPKMVETMRLRMSSPQP